jgi:hypothetical protein
MMIQSRLGMRSPSLRSSGGQCLRDEHDHEQDRNRDDGQQQRPCGERRKGRRGNPGWGSAGRKCQRSNAEDANSKCQPDTMNPCFHVGRASRAGSVPLAYGHVMTVASCDWDCFAGDR